MNDDPSSIIKNADEGSVVVVCDREDYLKDAFRERDDKEVYEQVSNNLSVLVNTIMKALGKNFRRTNLSKDTLNYLTIKNPKFARIYLLPEIHKRLHDVSEVHSFQIVIILLNTYLHF